MEKVIFCDIDHLCFDLFVVLQLKLCVMIDFHFLKWADNFQRPWLENGTYNLLALSDFHLASKSMHHGHSG